MFDSVFGVRIIWTLVQFYTLDIQIPGTPGTWYTVPGIWYRVPGTRYQILGTWLQGPGSTWTFVQKVCGLSLSCCCLCCHLAIPLSHFEGLGMEQCHGSHSKTCVKDVMGAMAKRRPLQTCVLGTCCDAHCKKQPWSPERNPFGPHGAAEWGFIMMNHDDPSWRTTMMHYGWMIMIHHDASSWHDESSYSSW